MQLSNVIKRGVHHRNQIGLLAGLLVSLFIYWSFGLINLGVPGLQYDEAADAVPAMELLRGLPNTALSTVDLFGQKLPLMMGHYTGPSSIYTSLIGMTLFGTSVAGLRIGQLLLGAVSLCLLWAVARNWFGNATATIAVLLCASAPAYLWWSRAGAHFASPLVPIALILFLLLRHWWTARNRWILFTAALVFGLGMTTKLLFVWLVVPIGLSTLILLGIKGSLKLLRSQSFITILLCIAAFSLGFTPFIVHNIPSGASFRFIADNAIQSQAYGHNNLDLIGNLRFELLDYSRMMGGDTLHFDAPAGLPISAIAIVISVIYTAYLCITYRRNIPIQTVITPRPRIEHLRLRLFLLLCVVTVIPLGTVSISNIGARHLFMIVPVSWLLIGTCVVDLCSWLYTRLLTRNAAICSVGIVSILVANQVVTNVQIANFFNTTGGRGLWSDAIYTVADKLQSQYGNRPIMVMDWGFERNIMFLTRDRVHMQEMYEFSLVPSPKFADLASVMLRDPTNIYLFHAPEVTAFQGHLPVMNQSAAKMHKQLILLETVNERSGDANTLIYEADDIPRSFTISPTLATRNATLSGGLALLGGAVDYNPGKREVTVQLQWQTTADLQPDDTVLMHIVDQSNGQVMLNSDQRPVYGAYPFNVWQKGEVVTDQRWITLPPDLKPGIYQVRVGVYDRTTGVRRTITDPLNDSAGNSLMLHSFEIK